MLHQPIRHALCAPFRERNEKILQMNFYRCRLALVPLRSQGQHDRHRDGRET
jgi:hypothetical protein